MAQSDYSTLLPIMQPSYASWLRRSGARGRPAPSRPAPTSWPTGRSASHRCGGSYPPHGGVLERRRSVRVPRS